MTASPARRGEVVKLARTLGIPADDVPALAALDLHALRRVREVVSARLFDDARPVLIRVAKGSRLLPNSTVAKVGERVFGAMLCARVAGLLAPPHALAIALQMPDAFLAEVAAALDPRGAGEVVAAIPVERVVAVAHLLLARRDHITLARFVDHLAPATIGAVIDSIADELELLHIAVYVESPTKLAELVGQLAPPRLRAMIGALARGDGDTWLEVLAVVELLDEGWRRTLGDLAAELEPAVLVALVHTAGRHGVWTAAVPLLLAMSPAAQAHFLALPAVQHPDVLGAIAEAIAELALDPATLPPALRDRIEVRARILEPRA